MPGQKNIDNKLASFMTAAVKNRAGVSAVDPDLSNVPEIDVSRTPSANANALHIIVTRTAGAGTISIELWRQLVCDQPQHTTWIKVDESLTQATDTEKKFTGLVAAKYKLKVTALTAGASWDIYEYHSEEA